MTDCSMVADDACDGQGRFCYDDLGAHKRRTTPERRQRPGPNKGLHTKLFRARRKKVDFLEGLKSVCVGGVDCSSWVDIFLAVVRVFYEIFLRLCTSLRAAVPRTPRSTPVDEGIRTFLVVQLLRSRISPRERRVLVAVARHSGHDACVGCGVARLPRARSRHSTMAKVNPHSGVDHSQTLG